MCTLCCVQVTTPSLATVRHVTVTAEVPLRVLYVTASPLSVSVSVEGPVWVVSDVKPVYQDIGNKTLRQPGMARH